MKMRESRAGSGAPPGAAPAVARESIAELEAEISRKNFVRAAAIAASKGLPANEVREIQCDALWQTAVNRNAPGIQGLARQYGFSKDEVLGLLEERARRLRESGQAKILAACYDATTGKYLSFEEWTERLKQAGAK